MVSPTKPAPHQPHPSNAASPSSTQHAAPPSTPVRVVDEVSRRSTRKSNESTDFWTLPGTQWDQLQIDRRKKGRSGQSSVSDSATIPTGVHYSPQEIRGPDFSCQPGSSVNISESRRTSEGEAKICQTEDFLVPLGSIGGAFTQGITAAAPSLDTRRRRNQELPAETLVSSRQRGQIVSEEAIVYRPRPALVDRGKAKSPRGMARRPGRNQVDYVAELKESIHESLSKLSSIQEKLTPLGLQIIALEEELKAKESGSNVTLEDAKRLDELYRAKVKLTEQETSILHSPPDDLINKMGILNALAAREDNQAPGRGSAASKQRGSKRSTVDSESTTVDSPGPSPSDVRSSEQLRRVKGQAQRSSSVASQTTRDGSSRLDDGSDSFRTAERAKLLVLHAEVAYKQSKATHDSDGERIHCTINGIRKDKSSGRPLYDIKDKDESENLLYTAKFEDLLPIPPFGSQLPTFSSGKYVIALYPGTTTFYNAQVINLIAKRDVYSLKFEGEENEKEVKEVERRYVLDTKTK